MIKSAQNYILPSLKLLFNKILICGIYYKNWAHGYISPIFKSGNKDDPNSDPVLTDWSLTEIQSYVVEALF